LELPQLGKQQQQSGGGLRALLEAALAAVPAAESVEIWMLVREAL
jgi:hypothetical protein